MQKYVMNMKTVNEVFYFAVVSFVSLINVANIRAGNVLFGVKKYNPPRSGRSKRTWLVCTDQLFFF